MLYLSQQQRRCNHYLIYLFNHPNKFDKALEKGGFTEHITNEHNIMNYIFFINYLKNMDESEYGGVESHVMKLVLL